MKNFQKIKDVKLLISCEFCPVTESGLNGSYRLVLIDEYNKGYLLNEYQAADPEVTIKKMRFKQKVLADEIKGMDFDVSNLTIVSDQELAQFY